MPTLAGQLKKPNNLTPSERGLRQGIALNIARGNNAQVSSTLQTAVAADAEERRKILDMYEVAGRPISDELLEQLDARSELRKMQAQFNAADPRIAAQYAKQFDPTVMASNAKTLDDNINYLTRDVRTIGDPTDSKIDRRNAITDMAKNLADLRETNANALGKEQDNLVQQFDIADRTITQRLDERFGDVSVNEMYAMLHDGRMAQQGVPVGRAFRYIASREKLDLELQMDKLDIATKKSQNAERYHKLKQTKLNAAAASKQQDLLNMPVQSLDALLRQAKQQEGGVTFGNVQYSQVDIATAIETIHTTGAVSRDLKIAAQQVTVGIDNVVTKMHQAGSMMGSLHGGSGGPYAELAVKSFEDERAIIEAEAEKLFQGDTLSQQEYINKTMQTHIDAMDAEADNIIANSLELLPDTAKKAAFEAHTLNYISDAGTAINALEYNLSSFAVMPKSSAYAGAGQTMFGVLTGNIQVSEGGKKDKKDKKGKNGKNGKKDKNGKNRTIDPRILGKDKGSFDATDVVNKITNNAVGKKMHEQVTGRIAQAGAVGAFGIASTLLSENQRQRLGAFMFDSTKQGMNNNLLLEDRPEQINWATAVPEIADMIFASSDGTDEQRVAQIGNFFEVFRQGYVAQETVRATTQFAEPKNVPEHQIWALTRNVHDSLKPLPAQIEEMLQREAADLTTHSNDIVAEYTQRIELQNAQREKRERIVNSSRRNPARERGNATPLGISGLNLSSNAELAQQRNATLQQARQRAAAAARAATGEE